MNVHSVNSLFLIFFLSLAAAACTTPGNADKSAKAPDTSLADGSQVSGAAYEVTLSDAEWKAKLTPNQYRVLRQGKTERSFSHASHDSKTKGVYRCAGCGHPLFHSDAKYDSGTGWPSFHSPASTASVRTRPDNTLFTKRTEVVCARCGGHLGHVFDDGPKPTGLRYCMNGVAMELEAEAAAE
jgi:peptide-methionine (R)-S-oxide reductase